MLEPLRITNPLRVSNLCNCIKFPDAVPVLCPMRR